MSAVRNASQTPARANVKALNYRDACIVDRMVAEYEMPREEAQLLFEDTLRFLALTDNGVKLSPPARIDLGWHNFPLHTRQYARFCEEAFGAFIHHEPGSGLVGSGARLDVHATIELARRIYGSLSPNWNNVRGDTCGSNGC